MRLLGTLLRSHDSLPVLPLIGVVQNNFASSKGKLWEDPGNCSSGFTFGLHNANNYCGGQFPSDGVRLFF